MKYLKKSQINFRNVKDDSIAIQVDGEVTLDSTNTVLLPKGTTAQRPGTAKVGHMRYNTTTNEVEVYQGSNGKTAWRSIRYKESTQITQQNLGYGNDNEYIFGPLNPAPPSTVDDKSTWSGSNIIVLVENVVQLNMSNYVIIQNPCQVSSNVISFNSTNNTIVSSNQATVDFVSRGFWVGQSITISGSASNNGTFTITGLTPTTITVSQPIVTTAAGATISIAGKSSSLAGPVHGAALPGDPYPSGYYLKFDSPVPAGSIDPKYVTVLHGFDQ